MVVVVRRRVVSGGCRVGGRVYGGASKVCARAVRWCRVGDVDGQVVLGGRTVSGVRLSVGWSVSGDGACRAVDGGRDGSGGWAVR